MSILLSTLFSALFAFTSIGCFSQQHYLDSLETLAKTSSADTSKVLVLNTLVTSLREGDNNKALDYALQAKKLAEDLKYTRGLGRALENLGWLYYRKGDYSKAFEMATEALRISETFHDNSAIAKCLNSIAAINYEQKQYDLAIVNFKRALHAGSLGKDFTSVARSLNNIAFMMFHLGETDSAKIYAERGRRASEKADNYYLRGFAYRTLGDIDLKLNMHEAALNKFKEAIALADNVGNKFIVVSTLHRVANTHFLMNQPDVALQYSTQAVGAARKFGYRDELALALKLTSEIYASKKDIDSAYHYQRAYVQLHDSLYFQRNSAELALMQARFESQLKQAEIELLKKDTLLKQQEIDNHQLWSYFTVGLLSLAAIVVSILLYSNWVKRKANKLLGIKNQEIHAQAEELGNLNVTKDKLFSIISHDVRGPLASLRGLINLIFRGQLSQQEFIDTSVKLRQNLDSVQEDLDNLLHWAQSQLNGLQMNFEVIKIRTIIDDKVNLFTEAAAHKDITIINDVAEDLTVQGDKNHLSLIIRNLMANAIKFNTRGGLIRIQDKIVEDRVEISITDSGVGIQSGDLGKLFNAQTHFSNPGTDQEKGVGLGLLLTKEFIEKSGGSIWVTSEVGKGSTFTFTTKHVLLPDKAESISSAQ